MTGLHHPVGWTSLITWGRIPREREEARVFVGCHLQIEILVSILTLQLAVNFSLGIWKNILENYIHFLCLVNILISKFSNTHSVTGSLNIIVIISWPANGQWIFCVCYIHSASVVSSGVCNSESAICSTLNKVYQSLQSPRMLLEESCITIPSALHQLKFLNMLWPNAH
jgi:hypothetical protein